MALSIDEYKALFRVYMTLPMRAFLTYENQEIGEFHQENHAIELLSGKVVKLKDIETGKLSLKFDKEQRPENEPSHVQTYFPYIFMPQFQRRC